MSAFIKARLDQKQAELDAVSAEQRANYDARWAAQHEFDALREQAKTECPGNWNTTSKYAQRLWELIAEITRYSNRGMWLQQEMRRIGQEKADILTVNHLHDYTAGRLI